MDCPTCHQRIPEPRPFRDASPDDHRAARAVRAVLNELVGQPPMAELPRVVTALVADRLAKLGYRDASGMAERAVAYVLSET
jgi:hypothetical protein